MSSSEVVILILVVMNVIQFVLSARDRHVLINKIMSRDYADYAYQSKLPKKSPSQAPNKSEEIHVEEDKVLEELNRMFNQ